MPKFKHQIPGRVRSAYEFIKAHRDQYSTRRWAVGKPSVLIPNLLQRRFTATRPNIAWVTDITYIRTWQGWLTSLSSWICSRG